VFSHVPFEATLRQIKSDDEKDKLEKTESGATA
jgi:hypothetical protein